MTPPAIMKGPARCVVRKEKPLPPSKPQNQPPAPTGIRAPGNGASSNGMICPGTGR